MFGFLFANDKTVECAYEMCERCDVFQSQMQTYVGCAHFLKIPFFYPQKHSTNVMHEK